MDRGRCASPMLFACDLQVRVTASRPGKAAVRVRTSARTDFGGQDIQREIAAVSSKYLTRAAVVSE
jgi:hypothetical protein